MLPSSKKDPAKSKTREKSIKKPSLSGGCLVVAFPVQLLSLFYWIHNSLCFLSGHPDISEVNRLCVKLKIECSLLVFLFDRPIKIKTNTMMNSRLSPHYLGLLNSYVLGV